MTQNALKTYMQNLVTIWKLETSKSMKTVWQSHDIATNIKVRLWKVWQAMACWHPRMRILDHRITGTSDESRIEAAFELKGLRQVLRVWWTTWSANEWRLDKARVKRSLLASNNALPHAMSTALWRKILSKEVYQEAGREEYQRLIHDWTTMWYNGV